MHNLLQMSEESRAAFVTLKEREAPKLAERFSPRDADLFWVRMERYFEDIYSPLKQLYGEHPHRQKHYTAIFDCVVDAYLARAEPLRLLDLERQITPDWFERPNMVGYVCYPQFFAGQLSDVRNKLDYLQELGITYIHLMSLLKPRPGKNDGGYAIMDYRAVNPELGDMADLNGLAKDLRERGISLCVDLVLNHTAKKYEM